MSPEDIKVKLAVYKLVSDQSLILDDEIYSQYVANRLGFPISWVLSRKEIPPTTKEDVIRIFTPPDDTIKIIDGDRITRVKPFRDTHPDPISSIYIEGIGKDLANKDSLLTILSRPLNADGASPIVSFDIPSPFQGHVVVTLPSEDMACRLVSTFDCHSHHPSDPQVKKRGWRVMPLTEYHRLKAEYIAYRREVQDGIQRRIQEPISAEPPSQATPSDIETPSSILLFSNVPVDSTKESLGKLLGICGKVAYVDYTRKERECLVRFDTPQTAKDTLDHFVKANHDSSSSITPRYLTGAEGVWYMARLQKDRARKKKGEKPQFSNAHLLKQLHKSKRAADDAIHQDAPPSKSIHPPHTRFV